MEVQSTRLLQGIALGAITTMFIEVYWGWGTLGKTAKEMVEKNNATAVVATSAPTGVDKLQRAVGTKANLTESTTVGSWQQCSFVQKDGWETLPGSDPANTAVAQSCANPLTDMK